MCLAVSVISIHFSVLQDTVNVTTTHGVFVRVRAGIDIIKREVTWDFMTLDPETGIYFPFVLPQGLQPDTLYTWTLYC